VLDVVVVVVDDVLAEVEVVVGVVVAGRQSWLASWPTVETPWSRLRRSVGLTEAGSSATARLRSTVALETPSQLPACRAEEIWSSRLLIELDWSAESRPEPPPHAATMSETATPRPPARMARATERIRALTLDSPGANRSLGPH
jgi:hypothetical protein